MSYSSSGVFFLFLLRKKSWRFKMYVGEAKVISAVATLGGGGNEYSILEDVF